MAELHEIPPEPIKTPKEDKKPVKPHKFFGAVQKIQRYSSFTFLGFMGLHLGSVVFATALSPKLGDEAIQFTRAVYQAPLIEEMLVYGSIGAHLVSGLILRFHKIYLSKLHYGRFVMPIPSPISISGILLIPFLFGHVWDSRIVPNMVLGDSSLISLQYINFGMKESPGLSWIAFGFLTSLTLFHSLFGMKKWLNLYGGNYKLRFLKAFLALFGLSLISLFRVFRMPVVTGWLAQQYQLALSQTI